MLFRIRKNTEKERDAMIGMIYREFLIQRKKLLMILPLFLFFSLFPLIPALTTPDLKSYELQLTLGLATLVFILISGMFEEGLFENDESKIWRAFILSAPSGNILQILTKYIFVLLLSGFGALLILLMIFINGAIMKTDISINIDALMSLLAIQLFIRTLEIPFIVRFGSKNGNYYRMILLTIVSLGCIIYGLFGDLSIFGSLESFLKWFMDFFSKEHSLLFRLLPLAVMPFYFLSFLLSCRIYRNEKNSD